MDNRALGEEFWHELLPSLSISQSIGKSADRMDVDLSLGYFKGQSATQYAHMQDMPTEFLSLAKSLYG